MYPNSVQSGQSWKQQHPTYCTASHQHYKTLIARELCSSGSPLTAEYSEMMRRQNGKLGAEEDPEENSLEH